MRGSTKICRGYRLRPNKKQGLETRHKAKPMRKEEMDGGHDAIFVNSVDHRDECPICHFTLKEATLTVCGHEFCKSCLSRTTRGGVTECPVCRQFLRGTDIIYPSNKHERELLSLTIKCDLSPDGCDWTGELRQRQEHNAGCKYVREICTQDWGETIRRKDQNAHLKHDCSKRQISCKYCKKNLLFDQQNSHQQVCFRFPVKCPYCQEEVAREEMDVHVGRTGNCLEIPLHCDFSKVGCTFTGKRQQLMEHLSSNVSEHLTQTMETLVQRNEHLADVQTTLTKTRRTLTAVQTELNQLQYCAAKANNWSICRSVEQQFVYLWKIDNWSQTLGRATSEVRQRAVSSTFYSGHPGYLLRLVAFPNRDAPQKELYLSVYVELVKGEYDAKLEWPLDLSMTLSVVDQSPKDNDIVYSDQAKAELMLPEAYQSVRVCGKANMISYNAINTKLYIRDNTVLIKLVIDS